MPMREVPHGGVLKDQEGFNYEFSQPSEAYGIEPTVEHGGIIKKPEGYNGAEVPTVHE